MSGASSPSRPDTQRMSRSELERIVAEGTDNTTLSTLVPALQLLIFGGSFKLV